MKKTKRNSTKIYKFTLFDIIDLVARGIVIGLLISAILFNSKAKAYDLGLKYGVGFGLPNATDDTESKLLSFEASNELGSLLRHKLSLGAWFDPHPEFKRTSAAFGAYSMGLRIEAGYLYLENYFGLALISSTDSMLSSTFEFTEELGAGIKDDKGRFLGIEYRHFSNAGIQLPNKGRDFILINTGVGL